MLTMRRDVSRSGQRRGVITFAELFIILSIATTLIGLLLPAVQKVREAAARMTAVRQLRPLGVEIATFSGQVTLLQADSLLALQQILRARDVGAVDLDALLQRYDNALNEHARLLQAVIDLTAQTTDPRSLGLLNDAQVALEELEPVILDIHADLIELQGGSEPQ